MVTIELYPTGFESNLPYLIVESETGVVYSNQVFGTRCEIRKVEGYLVPVGNVQDAVKLQEFWQKGLGSSMDELGCLIHSIGMHPDDPALQMNLQLELDWDRIETEDWPVCVEGWVPVKSELGRGILTFENSD